MRSLVNIVKGGTAEAKRQLMIAIITDGLSYSAANAYAAGTRKPKLLYRINIQKHVKRIYGVTASLEELFPEK